MDDELRELIDKAKKRGSSYVKMDFSPDEFSQAMAELGVYLLEEYDHINTMPERSKRIAELKEIHNKVDHFRQAVFNRKRDMMK